VIGDIFAAALVVAALFVPLAVFGWAAVRYGVDSRPGIRERDRRPWL